MFSTTTAPQQFVHQPPTVYNQQIQNNASHFPFQRPHEILAQQPYLQQQSKLPTTTPFQQQQQPQFYQVPQQPPQPQQQSFGMLHQQQPQQPVAVPNQQHHHTNLTMLTAPNQLQHHYPPQTTQQPHQQQINSIQQPHYHQQSSQTQQLQQLQHQQQHQQHQQHQISPQQHQDLIHMHQQPQQQYYGYPQHSQHHQVKAPSPPITTRLPNQLPIQSLNTTHSGSSPLPTPRTKLIKSTAVGIKNTTTTTTTTTKSTTQSQQDNTTTNGSRRRSARLADDTPKHSNNEIKLTVYTAPKRYIPPSQIVGPFATYTVHQRRGTINKHSTSSDQTTINDDNVDKNTNVQSDYFDDLQYGSSDSDDDLDDINNTGANINKRKRTTTEQQLSNQYFEDDDDDDDFNCLTAKKRARNRADARNSRLRRKLRETQFKTDLELCLTSFGNFTTFCTDQNKVLQNLLNKVNRMNSIHNKLLNDDKSIKDDINQCITETNEMVSLLTTLIAQPIPTTPSLKALDYLTGSTKYETKRSKLKNRQQNKDNNGSSSSSNNNNNNNNSSNNNIGNNNTQSDDDDSDDNQQNDTNTINNRTSPATVTKTLTTTTTTVSPITQNRRSIPEAQ